MRIGILQCDSVRPEFREQFGDYPDMFRTLLNDESIQPRFVDHDLRSGDVPRTPDDCDAWVITGSRFSVNDPEPWITDAHSLVRDIHASGRPLVGICFGHQLIASALGGCVEQAGAGWGAGLHTSQVFECRPWMQPRRDELSLLVSHQDQVSRPPPGARVLAGHDFCPYDMLLVGDSILSFQGHPEFAAGYSRALIELRAEQIGTERAQTALESLARPADSSIAAQWIWRFIEHAQASAAATMRGSRRPTDDSK